MRFLTWAVNRLIRMAPGPEQSTHQIVTSQYYHDKKNACGLPLFLFSSDDICLIFVFNSSRSILAIQNTFP